MAGTTKRETSVNKQFRQALPAVIQIIVRKTVAVNFFKKSCPLSVGNRWLSWGMELIPLSEVMKASPDEWHTWGFCTADTRRKTAGEYIEEKARLMPVSKNAGAENPKDPGHFSNDTRNLELPSGQVRKFHPRLLLEFDGKEVIY